MKKSEICLEAISMNNQVNYMNTCPFECEELDECYTQCEVNFKLNKHECLECWIRHYNKYKKEEEN